MPNNPELVRRNINTLLNWDVLYPGIKPVLVLPYSQQDNSLYLLVKRITRHWKVLVTTAVTFDMPELQGMFKIVGNKTDHTPFIGYADSDIVFDFSILETLRCLLDKMVYLNRRPMLITGHSFELVHHRLSAAACLRCITNLSGITRLNKDQDYFFLSREHDFPWHNLPQLLVGRDHLQEILVRHALLYNVTLIDATITLFAVRQVPGSGQGSTFLDDLALKTWPAHVQCPLVYANRCLALDFNK